MKRKLALLLTLCMIAITCLSNVNSVEASNKYFEGPEYSFEDNLENDKKTYNRYMDYIQNNKTKSFNLPSSKNKVMSNKLTEKDKYLLNHDFLPFQLVEKDMDVVVLEENQNSNISSAICYDKENDIYFYVETNGNQDNLLFYINGTKYILEEQNENIYLISESGARLTIVETTIVDEIGEKNEIQPRASWILLANNLKKTNKTLVTVLSIVSSTAGVINIVAKHPVLGAVSLIAGVAATVGDQIYVTLYIKFSQSYRSDCTSYIKEVDNYYQYNNYTGFVKSRTWYFHSVRPDYAGQNCMAY